MSIFPTNKTVPLVKDIASSSTYTQSLGISTARTDLDSILAAIDSVIASNFNSQQTALSNEVTARTNADTALQSNITAEANTRAAAILAEQNARIAADSVEQTARQNADTALQTQIDGERSPLRLTVTGTSKVVTVGSAKTTRTDAAGNTSNLLVMNGALASDFGGATLDFSAGTIIYTNGNQTNGSFSLISFAGNASKYAKYALVLLPGSPNSILVLNGSVFGTTAALATEPAASGGVLIGFVTVQDTGSAGAGTINNMLQTGLEQAFASGSGGGSGGSGSQLDPSVDETFTYYTRSDFKIETNTFVGTTTGTDQTLGLGKVVLNVGNQFISKDLTGKQIWDDVLPINQAQVRLLYNASKVDSAPTIEASRDGGSTYSTATTYLPASDGNIVVGDVTFPNSSSALYSGGTPSGTTTTSANRVAALFTPSYRTNLTTFGIWLSTPSATGTIVGKLYSTTSGTPNTVLGTSVQTYVAASDVTSTRKYVIFTLATPVTLFAGTTYAFSAEGTGCTVQSETVTSPPAFSAGSSAFGSGWVFSASSIAYQAFGTGVDLRIRVTSGTAASELAGFLVDYVLDSPQTLQGDTSWEDRFITSTEASTGTVTLSRVKYTPGAHQLQAIVNGHTYMAPDFVESSINQVQFPSGFFQAGDEVRFYVAYGLIDGSSLALSRVASFYDAIVGSSAQFASNIATHTSLQAAINANPTGAILILRGYVLNEAITITSNGLLIEGQGYNTQIPGSVTLSGNASFNTLMWLRFNGNVSISSGSTGNLIRDSFIAPTATLSDAGNGNSKFLVVG